MKCQHTLDMTAIDTGSLIRTTDMLEKVFSELQRHEPGVLMHEMCVLAGLEEFEMVLERSGSLLGRRIGSSFASSPGASWPVFSEVFRQAARHGIISVDTCHRWIEYREVLNVTTESGHTVDLHISSFLHISSWVGSPKAPRVCCQDSLKMPESWRRLCRRRQPNKCLPQCHTSA